MRSREALELSTRLFEAIGRVTYRATMQGTKPLAKFNPQERFNLLRETEKLISYWFAHNKHWFLEFGVEDLNLSFRIDDLKNELVVNASEKMKCFLRGEIGTFKMKNDKAVSASARLMAKIHQVRDEVIPAGTELSDELLQKLRKRLETTYEEWLVSENLDTAPFFKQKGIQLIVIRRSTTEFTVGLSEKLRHWAEGLLDDKYEYYVQPSIPNIPPHRCINIGLDWDHTFTEDIEGWYMFVKLMMSRGHHVYIVTMRYEEECLDIPQVIKDLVSGVYPTAREAKNEHMLNNGIVIDVWIDDNPKAIFMNAAQAFGHATPKGVVVSEQSHGGN